MATKLPDIVVGVDGELNSYILGSKPSMFVAHIIPASSCDDSGEDIVHRSQNYVVLRPMMFTGEWHSATDLEVTGILSQIEAGLLMKASTDIRCLPNAFGSDELPGEVIDLR